MPSSPRSLPQKLAVLLAIIAGGLAFLDYFFTLPILRTPTQIVLKIVILTSAAALMLAAFNLLWRHIRQARAKKLESIGVILGFIVMFIAGLLPTTYQAGVGRWLYEWLLAPGMAAIFALLPIFLIYALLRHLDIRSLGGALLFAAFVIVLLGQTPWIAHALPWLAMTRYHLLTGPAAIAFRGVLLGIALGILITLITRFFPRLR